MIQSNSAHSVQSKGSRVKRTFSNRSNQVAENFRDSETTQGVAYQQEVKNEFRNEPVRSRLATGKSNGKCLSVVACETTGETAREMDAVMDGNDASFGEVARSLWNYLVSIADKHHSSRLRSKFGSSDIVQMSFMEAREKLQDFRGQSIGEFRAWLRQIVINNIRDETRRYVETQCRNQSLEISINHLPHDRDFDVEGKATECPTFHLDQDESSFQLHQAIDRLSFQEQEVIAARYQRGDNYQQIGEELNVPEATARKLRFRAINKLRGWLIRK